MKPPAQLIPTYCDIYAAEPSLLTHAPGRVNLMGGHVDYNEGWVLPVAINRFAWIAASPSASSQMNFHAIDLNEYVTIPIDHIEGKVDDAGHPLPTWALYPAAVAWALQKHGIAVRGLNAVLTSDIPIGSGLSSSAAIEVAFATTWLSLLDLQVDPLELAKICQIAENDFVGVRCGLMDQFASLHGVAGNALLFDCRTHEWEPVPLPEGVALVIADTGLRRALGNSAYNDRRLSCEQAVHILSKSLPGVTALRDLTPNLFEKHAQTLPKIVRRRAEHVVHECARVLQGVELLRDGDPVGFGSLMVDGHNSSRDLYEVSSPELDAMVEIAVQLPGFYGARLTGAGFGGCTINLVKETQAELFAEQLEKVYLERTGHQGSAWVCHSVSGAATHRLDDNLNPI